ncbi:hypothetical protein [Paenibacillus sp. L3-i20]|uniref:hypothetical protein n=1 Tax=Paenibacillus sp. L3-i20 TaxID=2905833 RepID=UPI001EDE0D11|nr:hypothetical protein [Paenibacillus sp. L3-i20]GKU77573.1 hypothetical protein L3i20_v219700 [Paenibacillus sp. L3-i20]
MDNELSNGIHIAVNLMVISVVIGIILLFTALGQNFSRGSVDSVAAIQAGAYSSDLIESAAHGPMPAAAVFVLLERNASVIDRISGSAYSQWWIQKPDDLLPLLDKKVTMTVTEKEDNKGIYDVVIGEE